MLYKITALVLGILIVASAVAVLFVPTGTSGTSLLPTGAPVIDYYTGTELGEPSESDLSHALSMIYAQGPRAKPEEVEAVFHYLIDSVVADEFLGRRLSYAMREASCPATAAMLNYFQGDLSLERRQAGALAAVKLLSYMNEAIENKSACYEQNVDALMQLPSGHDFPEDDGGG